MELPGELKWLEWVVGTDWPEGDEDALWRMRDAWNTAAEQVREIVEAGDVAYYQVIGGMGGSSADQFTAYWRQFADGDDAYLAKLAHACEALAQLSDSTGTEIEYAKYQFIIFLIILACQIAYMLAMAAPTFGASTAGIPVAEVATQSLIRVVAQNVLRSIITFVLQNVVSDVVIQMVQLGEGHRTHFDASKTIHAAIDGAISGAIFGVVGTGIHLGGAKIAPHLADSALGRIGEGAVTNVLGSAATSIATGQPLTLDGLAKQATAGAVGSTAHHDSDGTDPVDTDLGDVDEPDLPHDLTGHPTDDPAHGLPDHLEPPPPDFTHPDPTHPDPAVHDDPAMHADPAGHDPVDPGRQDVPVRDDRPATVDRPVVEDTGRGTGPYPTGDHIYDALAGTEPSAPQEHGTSLAGTPVDLQRPESTPSVPVPPDVPPARAPGATPIVPVGHDGPVVVPEQGGTRPPAAAPVPSPAPTAAAPATPQHTAAPGATDHRQSRPDTVAVVTHAPGFDAQLGGFHDRGPSPDGIGWRGEAGRVLTVDQNSAADAFLRRAYANESTLTPQLRDIAHGVDGGRLFGEEYARKSEDSFKRKLADEIAADPLLPVSAHLAEMKDAVRYTVGLPEHGYAEGARHVIDGLLDRGFEPVKFKNFWGEPEGYRGINSFWHDPHTGQVFEVQFHTEASFQAKSETHGLYEIERTTTDPTEKAGATAAMNHRFAQVPVPDGAAHLGIGDHPLHEVSHDPTPGSDPHDRAGDWPTPQRVTDLEAVDLVRESVHRTPSGYAFFPPGDEMRAFADAVHPRDGVVNLDLHGSADGFHIGDKILTGEQFAHAVDALRREGLIEIGPHDTVRLGACDVARGEDSPAARFARESGYRVLAPTERLWTNLHGDEIVSSARLRDGRWVPGEPPDGHWVEYHPDGEAYHHIPAPRESAEYLHDLRSRGPVEDEIERMLHDAPPGMAEALRHDLAAHPDLVSVLHDSPELRHSLLSRPLTLHHVAEHPEAVRVLRDVVDEIQARGAEAMLADGVPSPRPTDLTPDQLASSEAAAHASTDDPLQRDFDRTRTGDVEYLTGYLDRLYADARHAQVELNALADRIATDTGGEARYREHPKDRTRAMDKARKYAFQLDKLNDLAAACVILEHPADIYRALDIVRSTPGVRIADFDDRLRAPQRSGYRDIQMTVRMSNGHAAEFRLHLRAIEGVSEWEHSLYEVRRDLDAVSQAEDRPLTDNEQALVNAVLRREQDAFWTAQGGTA